MSWFRSYTVLLYTLLASMVMASGLLWPTGGQAAHQGHMRNKAGVQPALSNATKHYTGKTPAASTSAGPNATTDKNSATAKAEGEKTTAAPGTLTPAPQEVSPIDLVRQPGTYLNKNVRFKATFNSFASLGLDYKPALRDSKDYVSMLVLRPDVAPTFKIPMSELKLFYPRKKSDAVVHLDAGDTIEITGTLFSQALGEPWVDVQELVIVQKVKPVDKAGDKSMDKNLDKASDKNVVTPSPKSP
jgi:hypothetical protein